MNVVAINGSPHGMKGTTGLLLSAVIKSARAAGATVTTLLLADYNVGPCRACDACHKAGACPIKDDFARFRAPMVAADGVILASPNYISSVSAQMKALMDRCCGLLHCQAFKGKYSAAVVTSGGSESKEVEDYILGFLRAMGSWTVGGVGASAAALLNPAARPKALEAAAELGSGLTQAIASRKTYAEQVPEQSAFAERMKQLVRSRKDQWVYEYEYWNSRGWT